MNNGTQSQTESLPDYVTAFGLDIDPFRDSLEDRFFYADPALMQRLDLLQHLTQFSDQLLYVRGAEGAGKTTLLRQLKLRAAEHWRLCHLDGARLTTPAELYVELSRCFPETHSENTDHFGTDLLHYCLGLQQNGQLAVVLVDAAEQLPQAVLEALLSIGGNPGETLKALRILLFGTPELLPTLQALGLNSPTRPLLHTLDLPAFDEQQSAAYLMYRLAIAGYSGDSPFSSTEVRGMHKAASGLPGELNQLARTTLIEQGQRLATRRQKPLPTPPASTPARQPRPSGSRWFVVLAGVAALIIAGGFGWLWYLGNSAGGPASVTEQTVALPPPRPLPKPAPAPPTTPAPPEAIDPGATPPLLARRQAETPSSTIPAGPEEETPPVPPTAPADTSPGTPTPTEPAEPMPGDTPTPEPESEPAAASITSTEPAPATETAGDQPPESVEAAQASETSQPAPEPAAPPAGTDSSRAESTWVQRQPADHYTLQLLGARSPETVETFLDNYGESVELHPVLTQLKGADYHIVLTGSYPDRTAAVAQIDSLPAALRKLKPWPRRFSQIREGMTKTP